MDIASEEGWADFFTENPVFIGFSHSRMPCVKAVWHGASLQDSNGGRQGAVEGAKQVLWRDGRLQSKTRNLAQCMDACVGTSRTLWQWSFAGDPAEGLLQFALDGAFTRLNLPASELRAVVCKGKFPGLRSRNGLVEMSHRF